MKLVDKDNDKAAPVHMSWDAAQAALDAGTHVLAEPEGERVEDQPSAQSPKPGTEPFNADHVDNSDEGMPNMSRQSLPAYPPPAASASAAAPAPAPAPAAPAKPAAPAPAKTA